MIATNATGIPSDYSAVLLFAQGKGLTSLRDIEISLRSHYNKWYHLGLTSVARTTMADANSNREAG
ncbi:DUF4372 domain-containing protein [Candidatus Latescibacterota bacterium]